MERERFELKVGIFVFVGIVALGAIITILGARQDMFARQYPLYAEFTDVNGLKTGAPVRLAGLSVGTVEAIEFPDQTGEKNLRVRLMVRTAVQDRIRQDSRASISTQGVLGDKFISINLGTLGDPVERGTLLPSEQPADYLALLDTAGRTLKNIESITGKLDGMVDHELGEETKEGLAELIGSISGILREVQTGDGLVHRLIYDKSTANTLDHVERTSANIATLTGQFKDGKGAVPYLVNDPASKESVQQLLAAAEDMQSASAGLKEIVARIERGDGTVGAMINDPGIYDDLRVLLGRAKRNRILRSVIRTTIDRNEGLEPGGSPPRAEKKDEGG